MTDRIKVNPNYKKNDFVFYKSWQVSELLTDKRPKMDLKHFWNRCLSTADDVTLRSGEFRCCLMMGESPPNDSSKAVNIKRKFQMLRALTAAKRWFKKKKGCCPNKLTHKHVFVRAEHVHTHGTYMYLCTHSHTHIHKHLSLQGDPRPSPTLETRSVGMQRGILQSPWLLTSALFGSAHKRRWSAQASLFPDTKNPLF